MPGNHLLIVEDEQRLAEILQKQLREFGFTADVANDGYVGKRMAEQIDYDLIILDINLPLLNGYELCKEIRKTKSGIPIIMLTAFSTADNKLAGFDAGADDYVSKPFDFRELLARIKVFLKRSDVYTMHSKLQIADFIMDLETKTATRAGKKIELTSREFALMEIFLRNKGKLLARDFIYEKVWGIDFEPGTNVIDVYVNYLRKKIDADFKPKLIHTKFGFGFYCSENEM
jgi:two-component system, OmpR family, copper resistance phosphate regulon response regulator CusR